MRYEAVNLLSEFMSVSEEPDFLTRADYEEGDLLLVNAVHEVSDYLDDLMSGYEEGYDFSMVLPRGSFIVKGSGAKETIHFPFMSCSMNVWLELNKNTNNPVFQLLRYFCRAVHCIRCILSLNGLGYEVLITDDIMKEYKVMDIFSLHEYELVYAEVSKYLGL